MSRRGDRIKEQLDAWLEVYDLTAPSPKVVRNALSTGLQVTDSRLTAAAYRGIVNKEAVRTAATKLGLNINDPSDQIELLIALASIVFPPKPLTKKAGRKIKLDKAKALKLRRKIAQSFAKDWDDDPTNTRPFPTADAIYKRVGKKWFQENYGDLGQPTIKQYIYRAIRPPKK